MSSAKKNWFVFNEKHELLAYHPNVYLLWDHLRAAIGAPATWFGSNLNWLHPIMAQVNAICYAPDSGFGVGGYGEYQGTVIYWVSSTTPGAVWPLALVAKPPSAPKRRESLSGHDKATLALVESSIPAYRNSDLCPVPGCTRTMYFKQMHLVCDVHGYTDTRTKRTG